MLYKLIILNAHHYFILLCNSIFHVHSQPFIFDESFIEKEIFIKFSEDERIYDSEEIQLANLYNILLNILKKARSNLSENYEDSFKINDVPLKDIFE